MLDGVPLTSGILLLAGLVLLFLAEPILRYPSAHYCFADFVQSFGPIRIEPLHTPTNAFMGDPAVIYHPWTIFNQAELRAGRFPVWNPYNGGGVPHLANYQSGVLSLYNLPFYLFDFKTGLLGSAFLKLFAIAGFTFLYLRTCGMRQAAALLGATSFTFAGYHVAWVSGAITATAATLPASFFFAEMALKRAELSRLRSTPAEVTGPLVGLSLSLALGLLAGHPENLYVGGLFLAGYIGFRLWQLRRSFGVAFLGVLFGRFVACAVFAVLLTAIQLLPFAEYMVQSEVMTGRSGLSVGLASRPLHLWPLLLTPHVLGGATGPYLMVIGSPVPFPEAIAPYAGATALFLAGLSLFYVRTSARIKFFVTAMVLWLIFVLNPLGLANAFRAIPGLSHLPINRGHDVWLFSVCCAAAWFLDALISRRSDTPSSRVIGAAGLGTVAAGLLGARGLISRYHDAIEAAAPDSWNVLSNDLAFFVSTFLLGLVAVLMVRISHSSAVRLAGAATLVGVAFLQTGFVFRNFNPTIEDRLVYPVTAEMKQLQNLVGRDTLLVTGGRAASLVADTNMVYELSLPNSYDGIWIRRYDRLYRSRFGAGSFPRTPLRFDPLGLDLFGVDYLLGRGPLINTELADRRGLALRPTRLAAKPKQLVQTFLATENQLQAVAVYATCTGPGEASGVILRLEAAESRELVTERTVSCESLRRAANWATLSFSALGASKGQRYRLLARVANSTPSGEVALHAWSDFQYRVGMLAVDDVRHEGTLAFDFAYDLDSFQPLATLGDRKLYRYLGGRSRYYTVGRSVLAPGDADALRLLTDPEHDVTRSVVLSDPPTLLRPEFGDRVPGQVEIVSEKATEITLEVSRSEPGYVVLTKPHYPGWIATVDGLPRPLLRANYAFMAVEVPAGQRRVVVRYRPRSLWWGAAMSLTMLAIGCGWIGWRSWKAR